MARPAESHCDPDALVESVAADKRRVEQLRQRRVELRHEGVGLSSGVLCLGGVLRREVDERAGNAGYVNVALAIGVHPEDAVVARAAEVRAVYFDFRIDDERERPVVFANAKTRFARSGQDVFALDGPPSVRALLEDVRLLLSRFALRELEHQIARLVEPDPVRALEAQADRVWIRPWRHHEVVLEPAALPAVHEVDPPVHLWKPDAGVARYPGDKGLAKQVVAFPRKAAQLLSLGAVPGADQLHAQQRRGRIGFP